jgi:hypothetical protein
MIFKENKMKGILLTLLVVFSSTAYAQGGPDIDTGLPLGNGRWLSSRNASGFGENKILRSTSGNDTEVNAPSGEDIRLSSGSTPVAIVNTSKGLAFQTAGQNVSLAAFVPTMVATPVAGTNIFKPGLNVVPTAAANTAAFLGAATPIVGEQFRINNASGASVRVKAAGGATLNGATAGGYVVVPNLASVSCFTASATNQVCEQPVIPTPAGP